MKLFSVVLLATALVISSSPTAEQSTSASNAWEPLKFFAGWRARETYKIIGPDEFIETF